MLRTAASNPIQSAAGATFSSPSTRSPPARGNPDATGASIRALYRFLDDEEEIGIDLDSDVVERAGEVISVIADGIEQGLFPFNPGEADWVSFKHCRYCEFNSLCPTNRDEVWESAREIPELESYVALVEPEDAGD